MWNYLRRKVANNPTVKKMSPAQKKRVGGRIILTGTLLLIVPLTGMLLSYSSVWMHVSFQIIWGTAMIIGAYSALFDHGLASKFDHILAPKFDQDFVSVRSTGMS